MRVCKICNIEKQLTEFGKCGKNTFRRQCKSCISKNSRSRYIETNYKDKIYTKIYGSYEQYFLVQLKRRDRIKTLSLNDCLEMLKNQNGKCALTGLSFVLEPKNPYLPTLDRIESGGSYTKENVRLVCNAANSFRNKWSDKIFFEICERVSEYNKNVVVKLNQDQ